MANYAGCHAIDSRAFSRRGIFSPRTGRIRRSQRGGTRRLTSIEEERLLFSELEGHLANMALFKVNTGLREQEVVNLRWNWETPVPELDTSVFVIPRSFVKNGLDRYVVLNRVAIRDRWLSGRARGVRVHVRAATGDPDL
jgi:integrase